MSDTIEDRIEEVDEIRSGHELYKGEPIPGFDYKWPQSMRQS